MAAERAQQERDFPWQRSPDDLRRASHGRRERETPLLDRRPLRIDRPEEPEHAAELGVGLPGLPQLLRDAAQAIKGAESRVLEVEDEMREALAAAEQRVHAAEARAKAAEDLARALEKRASEAIRAAERRADVAEASAKAAEAWVARVRRALDEPV